MTSGKREADQNLVVELEGKKRKPKISRVFNTQIGYQ